MSRGAGRSKAGDSNKETKQDVNDITHIIVVLVLSSLGFFNFFLESVLGLDYTAGGFICAFICGSPYLVGICFGAFFS